MKYSDAIKWLENVARANNTSPKKVEAYLRALFSQSKAVSHHLCLCGVVTPRSHRGGKHESR